MSLLLRISLCLSILLATSVGHVGAVTLYDAGLGDVPATQGWTYLTNPLFGASATQAMGSGFAELDTTPTTSDSAGYFSTFHPDVPVLDRAAGYTVGFEVRIDVENHGSNDRAGFSVLAQGSDNLGIELAFWEDSIWAQSAPGFTHAEETAFDTTDSLTEYALAIAGNSYTLSAAGSAILSGPLRDYPDGTHPVYGWTNILFFGDDTSSANARIELASIEVLTGTAIPEPSAALLAGLGGLLVVAFRRRFARLKYSS